MISIRFEENNDAILGFAGKTLARTPIKPVKKSNSTAENSEVSLETGEASTSTLPTADEASTDSPLIPIAAVRSTALQPLSTTADAPTNQNNSPVLTDRSATSSDEEPPGSSSDENENENLETAHEGLSTPSSDNESEEEEMANNFIKPRDVVALVPIFTGDKSGCTFREFAAAC